ncbi:CII family transcriptional regulator [Pantoea stewartii]|uniref:CII family transcriptional regulator n=1 Tax=Pantoea stewartii TaxID=66269 RepID=UPI0025A1360D|nr:CII family transcriptional regulator [Pantoea stewartii]
MEIASYRKKARQIESQLLSKLAEHGQASLAKVLEMNEAAVSRMKRPSGKQKYSFFQVMSLVMAYLDVVAPDSEIAQRLLRIEQLLIKEKAEMSGNSFSA